MKVCFWFCGFERSVLLYNSKFSTCFIYSLSFWNDVIKWIWLKFGSWLYGMSNVSCKCQWKNNTSNSKTCLWLCELWFKRLNALYSFHALIESFFSLWRRHMKEPKSHKHPLSLLLSHFLTNSLLPFQKHTHCGLNWIWQFIGKTLLRSSSFC